MTGIVDDLIDLCSTGGAYYLARCPLCGHTGGYGNHVAGYGKDPYRYDAEQAMAFDGWRRKEGRWLCPSCAREERE